MNYRNIIELDLHLVADGLRVPEGPLSLGDGSILLTEIEGQRISRVYEDGRKAIVMDIPGGPNGLMAGRPGEIYVCNNGGAFKYAQCNGHFEVLPVPATHDTGSIGRLNLDSGPAFPSYETMYCCAGGRRLESPNDLVLDQYGGIWFTDFGIITALGRNYGSICYLSNDGRIIRRVREGLVSPNGIGLSPDGKTLYVSDTILGSLWAFEITQPGHLADGPPRMVNNLAGAQRLDSLALEANGNICVATIGEGGISVFDPDGNWVDLYRVPDRFVTNICFGGPDMREAWITASGTGRLYRTRWPRPGLRLHLRTR